MSLAKTAEPKNWETPDNWDDLRIDLEYNFLDMLRMTTTVYVSVCAL